MPNVNNLEKTKDISRCIVLPLQPESAPDFNGVGLALHFLLGNTIVLHTGLKEFWFGWRVKKIFPEKKDLAGYCRGKDGRLDLKRLSAEQGIHLWIHGQVVDRRVTILLFNASKDEQAPSMTIPFSIEDELVGFCQAFIYWLEDCGLPFPEEQKKHALWPEKISTQGMDILGRALEAFYLYSSYDGQGGIDLRLFKEAVLTSPDSFMCQNLLGWAYYRNKCYKEAKASFLKALQANPNGTGAMSGLMWCGVFTINREEALYWAERKAAVRQEDLETAKQKVLNRFKMK